MHVIRFDLSVFLVPFLASDLNRSAHTLATAWTRIVVHSLTTSLSKSVFQQLSPGISEFHASDTDDELDVVVYDVVNITLRSLYCAKMFSGHNFYLFHQVLKLQVILVCQ